MKLSDVKDKIDQYFDNATAKHIIKQLEEAGVIFGDLDGEMPKDWVITKKHIEAWYGYVGESISDTNTALYPDDVIYNFYRIGCIIKYNHNYL